MTRKNAETLYREARDLLACSQLSDEATGLEKQCVERQQEQKQHEDNLAELTQSNSGLRAEIKQLEEEWAGLTETAVLLRDQIHRLRGSVWCIHCPQIRAY